MSTTTLPYIPSQKSTKICFHLATLFLMLLPLGLMLGIATIDLMMTGVALCFISYSCLTKNFSWYNEPWFKWAMGFWLWIMFISIWSPNQAQAFKQAIVFIRFPLFAAALSNWLMKHTKIRRYFLWSCLVTLTITSLDVYLQFYHGSDILGHQTYSHRLTGPGHKVNVGSHIGFLILPVLAFLLAEIKKRGLKNKISWCAGFLFLLLPSSILITGERTPSLLLLLSLVLLFIFARRLRKTLLVISIPALLITSIIIYHSPFLNSRVSSAISVIKDTSIGYLSSQPRPRRSESAYRDLFHSSWIIFKQNPITGVGVKQFYVSCEKQPAGKHKFCVTNAQNMYFELLACTGIIGFILFLSMSLSWLKKSLNRKKLPQSMKSIFTNNPIIIAVGISLLVRYWPLIATSSLFFAWNGMSYWLMAGWLLGYQKDIQVSQKKEVI